MKNFSKKLVFVIVLLGCALPSCKKKTDLVAQTPQVALALWDNARVIDSNILVLNTDTNLTNNGTYKFTVHGTTPAFKPGDVIVGAQGSGFLRTVSSVSVQGNVISLETTPAKMENVFKQGEFNFNMDLTGLHKTTSGFSYSASNISIYQNGPLSINLKTAQLDMDPNWFLDFSFSPSGIKSFEMSSKGGTLNGKLIYNVTASQAITLVNKTQVLKSYHQNYTKWIPVDGVPVPVVVEMDMDLIAVYSANISAAVNRDITFTSNNTFDLGMKYLNGAWQGIYNFKPTGDVSLSPANGQASILVDVALVPKMSIKLYGSAGPYASPGLQTEMKGTIISPSLDWDFNADAWVKTTVGASANILGKQVADYNTSWETPKLNYTTPSKIIRVSGDNQVGPANAVLPGRLKVQVLDSKGATQSNVPVYFKVTDGSGSVSPANLLSDKNGYAETAWTLGNVVTTQKVEATVKKSDGTLISGAPVIFTATTGAAPTIKDTDGNVYHTVTIGTQTWLVENLKTTHYNDGTAIVNIKDTSPWLHDTIGSYCDYSNTSSNGDTYGRLYNWYAVANKHNICPKGWHVPTDSEWTVLINFLGGDNLAGGKMKETGTVHWQSGNVNATNESGFTALPGGQRGGSLTDGSFGLLGISGTWWSSTQYGPGSAWDRSMSYGNGVVTLYYPPKNTGSSVRCVKD